MMKEEEEEEEEEEFCMDDEIKKGGWFLQDFQHLDDDDHQHHMCFSSSSLLVFNNNPDYLLEFQTTGFDDDPPLFDPFSLFDENNIEAHHHGSTSAAAASMHGLLDSSNYNVSSDENFIIGGFSSAAAADVKKQQQQQQRQSQPPAAVYFGGGGAPMLDDQSSCVTADSGWHTEQKSCLEKGNNIKASNYNGSLSSTSSSSSSSSSSGKRSGRGRKKSKSAKGQWTSEEDRVLVELVEKYGIRKWSQIAQMLKGRIGKQCRERWHNHLKPDIKKDVWTEEEDRILIEAHAEVGNKWAEIAKRLAGRTENSIKNHWNATKRRQFSRRKCRTKWPKPTSLLQNYIKSLNLNFDYHHQQQHNKAGTLVIANVIPTTSTIDNDDHHAETLINYSGMHDQSEDNFCAGDTRFVSDYDNMMMGSTEFGLLDDKLLFEGVGGGGGSSSINIDSFIDNLGAGGTGSSSSSSNNTSSAAAADADALFLDDNKGFSMDMYDDDDHHHIPQLMQCD